MSKTTRLFYGLKGGKMGLKWLYNLKKKCPAPHKAGPARHVKLTKPVRRSGEKLTADSIDGPFS